MIFVPAALFAQTTPAPLPAQQAAAPAAPAWSPSKDIGVFVFGRNSQTPDQQLKDESECYAAAKQQSGIDPKAPPAAAKSAEQKQAEQKAAADNANTPKGGRVQGAARGAAGGAAIGAIAGDTGKGAAAGAVAGTMRGGAKQREASTATKKEAANQAAANLQQQYEQSKAAYNQKIDTFRRGFAACMDSRSYSAK